MNVRVAGMIDGARILSRDRSDHVIGQNLEVDLKISSEYSTILPIFR